MPAPRWDRFWKRLVSEAPCRVLVVGDEVLCAAKLQGTLRDKVQKSRGDSERRRTVEVDLLDVGPGNVSTSGARDPPQVPGIWQRDEMLDAGMEDGLQRSYEALD